MYKDIFEAVAHGNITAVKHFIEVDGVKPSGTNFEGDTLAHVAVKNQDLYTLRYLLKKDPTLLSKRGIENLSLIEVAIGVDSVAIVKFLVEDCKVDIYDQGDSEHTGTHVHFTAAICRLDIFKYFIEERKVNVNLKDKWHQPLAFAAARGVCLNIIKYIVEECKADVTMIDMMGRNILCQSAIGCDLIVPKYLLDERKLPIDTNNTFIIQDAMTYATKFKDHNIDEFVKYFVENKRMNVNDGVTETPLHRAAQIGMLNMVKYLVQHGADIRRKNLQGQTPLQVATNLDVQNYLKELEHGRSRRSLQAMPRPNLGMGIQNVAGVLQLDYTENMNYERFATPSSYNIDNFLTLAHAYVVTRLHAQKFLPSPQDTIRSRMDPVAIDAVHNYLS